LRQGELQKVKNQSLTAMEFEKVEVINRAMNLAFAALSGDANLINQESQMIEAFEDDDIIRIASKILNEKNANVIYYHAEELDKT
jgi:zinc protease